MEALTLKYLLEVMKFGAEKISLRIYNKEIKKFIQFQEQLKDYHLTQYQDYIVYTMELTFKSEMDLVRRIEITPILRLELISKEDLIKIAED